MKRSMVKRSLSLTPSTPKQKRSKVSTGQSSLEAFFSSSSRTSPRNKVQEPVLSPERETTKLDAEYAERLARADGIDVALARKLETGWLGSKKQGSVTIDVDLIDELEAGPSNSSQKKGSSSLSQPLTPGSRGPRENLTSKSFSPMRLTQDVSVFPVYKPLTSDAQTFTINEEPWPSNSLAPYSFLAHLLATLAGTRSRIIIINSLTNALRLITRHHPQSLLPSLYLLSNALSPSYLPIELGLGPSIISKSIQHVSGVTPQALRRLYKTSGDVGDVAYDAKSNLRTLIPHPPLSIIAVYDSLLKIANTGGQGAAKQKQAIVERLLVAAKGEEIRFLARTLSQNLRVGAVRTSILTALARAMVLTPPSHMPATTPGTSIYHASPELVSQVNKLDTKKKYVDAAREAIDAKFVLAESLIKKVFVTHPNYDDIVGALLEVGLDGLSERVALSVGIPLHPTLGSPTRSLDEIYERLGDLPFTAEFKYDGQRAQVHGSRAADGEVFVRVFSRHLEDMTSKYPDVISLVRCIFERSPQTTSFILDSEIVAMDPVEGDIKSFQELSNRARKDVKLIDVKVAVGVFAFDLMYLDGEILLEQPFRKRRALLRARFPPLIPENVFIARLHHVQSCESESGRDAVEDFWEKAVGSRCEGLMIKLLDSGDVLEESRGGKEKARRKPLPATYEPDKRTSAWLKLKKDYVTGLADSLDLVPIGAWHGNGRKARWWSPILLAVYDPASGKLVGLCKCMSGFTDIFYKALTEKYLEGSDNCSRQPLWDCDTGGLKPSVYFKPQEVWEIRGADITLSPVSVAAMGIVSESRGLSLRFPRFIKVRDDKSIVDASTPEFVARMWKDQQGKGKNELGVDEGELVDVDMEEEVEEDVESERRTSEDEVF